MTCRRNLRLFVMVQFASLITRFDQIEPNVNVDASADCVAMRMNG